jgi:protein gp37
MAENSAISWTNHTFNPWIGCTKVGPACDGCYAENLMANRFGRVVWGKPGQRGTLDRTGEGLWKQPLNWDRKAAKSGEQTFVFCASLADVFDKDAPAEWRRDLFDLIRATPNLSWLLLTKRPQMIVKLFEEACRLNPDGTRWTSALPRTRGMWPRNAAIGCTVVTQAEADRDVPHLIAAKAALNPEFAFLSMEPLLEAVDLNFVADTLCPNARDGLSQDPGTGEYECCSKCDWTGLSGEWAIDWVIAGGETDQGEHLARPMHPDWVRSLRDQCAAAGVPLHLKQWGEWAPSSMENIGDQPKAPVHRFHDGRVVFRIGKEAAGRALDGVEHNARPVTS